MRARSLFLKVKRCRKMVHCGRGLACIPAENVSHDGIVSPMIKRQGPCIADEVRPVGYAPPQGYTLDVEVFTFSELRRRVSSAHMRRPQRLAFHFMALFTEGECEHMVDFAQLTCKPGSLLLLRPGQVQRFAASAPDSRGYVIMFRPSFLQSETTPLSVGELVAYHHLDSFPTHFSLSSEEVTAVVEVAERMMLDAQLHVDMNDMHRLLRPQVLTVLARLRLVLMRGQGMPSAPPTSVQRFRRYCQLVEREFTRLHHVSDYVKLLGHSEKSLNRAAKESADTSAKAYLTQRITLEAKRLLANTDAPIITIASNLGFDEATNFTKFFRREAGVLPRAFRVMYQARQ